MVVPDTDRSMPTRMWFSYAPHWMATAYLPYPDCITRCRFCVLAYPLRCRMVPFSNPYTIIPARSCRSALVTPFSLLPLPLATPAEVAMYGTLTLVGVAL